MPRPDSWLQWLALDGHQESIWNVAFAAESRDLDRFVKSATS
jgi:hypothetical protein